MRFKVGDKAVYPAQGVAVVRAIESREVAGDSINFYVLEIISSGAKLMVPVSASERAGMRALINDDEIEEVYSILRAPPQKISQRTWNRRFREFNEKLRTGSVLDVAEVLRDLFSLQATKELSYGEKKMLERSKSLIVSEVAAAKNVSEESIHSQISELMVLSASASD